MSLIKSQRVFKPMKYPKAYEYWQQHERMHWLFDEVPLADDIQDYSVADKEEQEFISGVMKLFTHNDVEVSNGYTQLLRVFKPTEVQMMLHGFAAREQIHIAAYSLFTETLGFPDSFYTEFLEVPEMKVKVDYLENTKIKKYEEYEEDYDTLFCDPSREEEFNKYDDVTDYINTKYKEDVVKTLAVYATLTEGVSLFAQFAMLLKYQTLNKYKGLGTIVEWSIKDEETHVQGNSWLFREFVKENPGVLTDEVKKHIYSAARQIVEYECNLVDVLNPPHLDNEVVKDYIKYITDQRLKLIGFKANYGIEENPFPFMEEVTGQVLTNFFEGRVTDYARSALTGDWEEVRNSKM